MALARSKCKSVAVAEIGGLKLLVKHRNSRTLGYLTTKLGEKDTAIAKGAKSAESAKGALHWDCSDLTSPGSRMVDPRAIWSAVVLFLCFCCFWL